MTEVIRFAQPSDVGSILKMYAPFILETAFAFERRVQSVEEFTARMEDVCVKHPFLVALVDDEVVGFTYSGAHKDRASYLFSVDVVVFVAPEHQSRDIGHRLFGCIMEILKELGYHNVYSGCSLPNPWNISLHESVGFTMICVKSKCGYKFDEWRDVALMENIIGDHGENPADPKSIKDLDAKKVADILSKYN